MVLGWKWCLQLVGTCVSAGYIFCEFKLTSNDEIGQYTSKGKQHHAFAAIWLTVEPLLFGGGLIHIAGCIFQCLLKTIHG